jgi:hypothetical protein
MKKVENTSSGSEEMEAQYIQEESDEKRAPDAFSGSSEEKIIIAPPDHVVESEVRQESDVTDKGNTDDLISSDDSSEDGDNDEMNEDVTDGRVGSNPNLYDSLSYSFYLNIIIFILLYIILILF